MRIMLTRFTGSPLRLLTVTILLSASGLLDAHAGGIAVPIEITGGDGATPYQSDLNEWTGSWEAPQAIYDRGAYQDDPDKWYQDSNHEGSTWSEGSGGYGVLVVDLREMRTLNRFRVFQMMSSDGKTTDIEIFKNTSYTGATAPASLDGGWVSVTDGSVSVSDGTLNGSYVSDPTDISVSNFSTRYIKLHVWNDGSYGNTSWIELKGIKGYYYSGGSYSINYLRGGPATAPLASFDYAPAEPVTGESIDFTDTSSDDGSVVSWSWNFGDGNTSTAQNPTHTYDDSDTYTVTLTVTDNDSLTDSASSDVTVVPGDFTVLSSRQEGNGVRLDLETRPGKTYLIYKRDNSFAATRTLLLTTNAPGTSLTIIDSNVVNAIDVRFYEIVEDDEGVLTTNPVVFAAYVTPTETGQWYRLSMPIDMGASNTLDSTLGGQLLSGVSGDALSGDLLYMLGTNGAWNTFMLNGSDEWRTYPGDDAGTNAVAPAQAFWVKRRTSGVSSNAVYTGPIFTNAPALTLPSDTWQLIAWPFPSPRREDAGTDKGWGFAAAGAQTGTSWLTADNLWVDGILLWLHTDGRWRRANGASAGNVELEALGGYYYLHRGDGMTWTPQPAP